MERKLFRSRKSRMFLGVCGGLAEYYRIDPVVVRVFTVLITVVSSFMPGIIAYFILALIIPLEGSQAGTSQETFRENLADLEDSSRHLGRQFRKNPPGGSPATPPSPSTDIPAASGLSFPPPTRSNRGLYILAVALVAIGVFFIIVNSFGWLWKFLFPLTLVMAGIIIITLVFTRKRQS
jgi:phage shock protein C